MSLTRIHDKKSRDRASLETIMELLKDGVVQERFAIMARGWTPDVNGMEATNEACARREIEHAIREYAQMTEFPIFRSVRSRLKTFRDQRLGHSLILDANELALFHDTSAVIDFTIGVMRPLLLGVLGVEKDFQTMKNVWRKHADGAFDLLFARPEGLPPHNAVYLSDLLKTTYSESDL
jgi:hypothetical protein